MQELDRLGREQSRLLVEAGKLEQEAEVCTVFLSKEKR